MIMSIYYEGIPPERPELGSISEGYHFIHRSIELQAVVINDCYDIVKLVCADVIAASQIWPSCTLRHPAPRILIVFVSSLAANIPFD